MARATEAKTAVRGPTKLLINGEWVEPAFGKYYDDPNPTTGETVATVADGSAEDIVTFVYGRVPEPAMLALVTLAGIIIAGVGVYDWVQLEDRDTGSTSIAVSPGAGLILTTIGGIALALLAGSRLSARRPPPP